MIVDGKGKCLLGLKIMKNYATPRSYVFHVCRPITDWKLIRIARCTKSLRTFWLR